MTDIIYCIGETKLVTISTKRFIINTISAQSSYLINLKASPNHVLFQPLIDVTPVLQEIIKVAWLHMHRCQCPWLQQIVLSRN